ncbi:hypothetical protein C0J45_6276 [Silurus meridionalis]|uniref:C-type lectin domain-containing protein n=1 Tax=Silurus meridionalis TaxID=175797 RepID=A0A8T0BMZ5_SILME|nr:hypothetical protein HF521_019994 [Silurus meridionalis]KAI5104650.1 hypothetical protein C0J45_6276 [Silurus meridionalis]
MASALFFILLFSGLWAFALGASRHYYAVKVNATWDDAQKWCRENYSDLATIENEDEMNAVKELLKEEHDKFWIGLKQNMTNKTWQEALRFCRQNHVDLLYIYSKEIQDWVEYATQNVTTDVWIGLRHTCALGFWYWVSDHLLPKLGARERNRSGRL